MDLTDQFGNWLYEQSQLVCFSNPDQKTHGPNVFPITNSRLHCTWWWLGSEGSVSHPSYGHPHPGGGRGVVEPDAVADGVS